MIFFYHILETIGTFEKINALNNNYFNTAGANWKLFSLHELLVDDVGVSYSETWDGSFLLSGDIFRERPGKCGSFDLV